MGSDYICLHGATQPKNEHIHPITSKVVWGMISFQTSITMRFMPPRDLALILHTVQKD